VHAVLCMLCCAMLCCAMLCLLCCAVLCCMLSCTPCCMLCMQSHFYMLCHLWSAARLSCTAKSAAASHHSHAISDMPDAEGLQNKGEGRKKRAGWKGMVHPFTAAGSSNAASATASTHPAASRYNHPLISFCGLVAARSVVILCQGHIKDFNCLLACCRAHTTVYLSQVGHGDARSVSFCQLRQ